MPRGRQTSAPFSAACSHSAAISNEREQSSNRPGRSSGTLGQRTSVTSCDAMRGDIELLAGDAQAAEAILRTACDDFEACRCQDLSGNEGERPCRSPLAAG